ncbi:MAG: ketopantoate reductase family protein [Chloroflexi bacterium]|nr:ketopantoate reductase family protein [Chloroflexota bacterium]
MRYVIYGAGAIGAGVGGRLHQHGFDVTLIARGAHLAAMQRDGLRLRAPGEDVRIAVKAVGHPSEIEWRGDEAVILTMKTQDTPAALEDLRAAAGSDVPVFCAQNGVENERMVARRFRRAYAMLIHMPSTFITPGEVIIQSAPVTAVMDAGRFPSGTDEVVTQVCADLSAAGCLAQPDAAVMRLKWAKLLHVNLGNAVQAVCGPDAPAGGLARLLRAEAERAFAANGIDCATLEEWNARAGHVTPKEVEDFQRGGGSTWQSLIRGATSVETDYLNGEIALLAALGGVEAPAHRALQDCSARLLREGLAPGSIGVDEVIALAERYGAV